MVKLRRAVLLVGSMALLAGCGADGANAPDSAAAPSAQAQVASDLEGVTVVGEGRSDVAPDSARVVVGVEVVRPDVRSAFVDANAAVADVLDALRDRGVEDEDLRTRELSLREQRDHPREGVPEVTGYVVTNLVEVTVRDVDRVGELVGAAVDAGRDAARVQHLEFVVDDGPLEDARRQAFADAERRAQQYADLAGRSLGELVALREIPGSGRPQPVPVPETGGQGPVAPVEPGQQEATVRIQATWSLD